MCKIIFDLDLTLVDSSTAEEARKGRNWPLVYSMIPQFMLYEGMQEVFDYIRRSGIEAAIVSTSPSVYVKRVIDHFSIPVQIVVGYHDAIRKPSPDGMIKAMNEMDARPEETISFGDRSIDIIASKAAGIKSVGCLWGTQEEARLIASGPDLVLHSPVEIIETLCSQSRLMN